MDAVFIFSNSAITLQLLHIILLEEVTDFTALLKLKLISAWTMPKDTLSWLTHFSSMMDKNFSLFFRNSWSGVCFSEKEHSTFRAKLICSIQRIKYMQICISVKPRKHFSPHNLIHRTKSPVKFTRWNLRLINFMTRRSLLLIKSTKKTSKNK